MARSSVERYWHQLLAHINGLEISSKLETLRREYPELLKDHTPPALADLVRAGNRDYAIKDLLLRVLLQKVKDDPAVFPLLHFMFWDSLLRLYGLYRRRVPDPDELFSRIVVAFFHTAVSYPLDRRPIKVDVNLILDTRKKIVQWQREEAAHRQRHEVLDASHEARAPLSLFQPSEVFPEEMEAYLLDLVYRNVITQQQYDLLLETQVYARMSQKEWAKVRRVTYATVRSWRFRAEQTIRRYEESRRRMDER